MIFAELSHTVDIQSVFERHGMVIAGKATNSREGREIHGSCPRCMGHDRFSIWPDSGGRFSCSLRSSGCGWHGSNVYFFLRDQGYSHWETLEELGLDPAEIDWNEGPNRVTLPLALLKDEPPCQKWQDAAMVFSRLCEKCLWGPKGETARTYLHSRGFTDLTIRLAHLGLCPDWYKESLEIWGLSASQLGKEDDPQIKIPRGITIPWYVSGSIHKIQLRRPEGGYFEILGSSECLYNVDTFQPGQPVLLVESEFDALSAQQEAGDLAAMLATGSTTKGRTSRWIGLLKQAGHVLQCFDDDDAGSSGAAEWFKKLPKGKVQRWKPWAHDCNDMLKTGLPIRLWLESGLHAMQARIELPPAQPATPIEQHEQTSVPISLPTEVLALLDPNRWAWIPKNDRGFASLCMICRCPATWWGTQGEPYCQKCCPWANTWPYNQSGRAS